MKLGLFIGEKPIFMKKKIRRSAVKNFVRLLFERSFQVRDFTIWIK
jgi:hypothetical protein